jgi:predicted DNA-binding transcriptional regulator AlpA
MQQEALLRLQQVIGDPKANPPIPALIPVGKTAWYAGMKRGVFPKPIKLSSRVAVWRLSDIQAIINQR